VRFIVDMPLSPAIAEWLRSLGHDAVHASEISLNRAPDTLIFSTALAEERVIVTADLDFPRLFSQLATSGPGLILLRGGNYSEPESIECLRCVLFALNHDELPKSVVVVDRERIRRRWLPVQ
jgi:predicted nuclease of predicted toxin-antitoxin system